MIKQNLSQDLKKVIEELGFEKTDLVLSIPQNLKFGDYTSNIPLQLANQKSQKRYQTPLQIANQIKERLESRVESRKYLQKIDIAGAGFLNFFLKPSAVSLQLSEILDQGLDYGQNQSGNGQKVQVEFISANPTGPLTLANGRGGAIGDAIANVLQASGYQIEREYYLNDTGNQIYNLGNSILAAAGKIKPDETHYKGDYVQDLAVSLKDNLKIDPQSLGYKAAHFLLDNEIKPAILGLNINFDRFFSERTLYPNQIEEALSVLKQKGLSYEKDGAIWFKSPKNSKWDDKDRVLMTSPEKRGQTVPTYFLADLAHHLAIYKEGFSKRVLVVGADHHSYFQRLDNALKAIYGEDKLDVVLMQLVRLIKNGQEVKMSKRAGTYITLDELLDEVSADGVRFFFLMVSQTTHLDFDLELAKEHSSRNPVFYVQYAHARMSSILNKATVTEDQVNLALLIDPKEIDLINHLTSLPDLVLEIASNYKVHHLASYAIDLADKFHQFYENCPVLQAKTQGLVQARLTLVKATQLVLANSLRLMGISAPEKM